MKSTVTCLFVLVGLMACSFQASSVESKAEELERNIKAAKQRMLGSTRLKEMNLKKADAIAKGFIRKYFPGEYISTGFYTDPWGVYAGFAQRLQARRKYESKRRLSSIVSSIEGYTNKMNAHKKAYLKYQEEAAEMTRKVATYEAEYQELRTASENGTFVREGNDTPVRNENDTLVISSTVNDPVKDAVSDEIAILDAELNEEGAKEASIRKMDVYVLKNGTRIRAKMVMQSGDDYNVQDDTGKMHEFKKDDIKDIIIGEK